MELYKVFDIRNGQIMDLGYNWNKALERKHILNEKHSGNIYWIVGTYKPVFSSRGEYLGYIGAYGFYGVSKIVK